MIINREKARELEEIARPMIKWINDNCDPHATILIDCESVALSEGAVRVIVQDYIKD
jgi:hypothetical protein